MIIDVQIEGEDGPRRYRVRRQDGTIRMWRLAAGDNGSGDATAIQVDWRMPEPGNYSLLVDGRSYDVHINDDATDTDLLEMHLLSHLVRARAGDARRHRGAPKNAGTDGVVSIMAPIPGRVIKVLTPPGTAVKQGDGIIVLEAMKMENELKAPRDGIVTDVVVQEGAGVEGGAILATIE